MDFDWQKFINPAQFSNANYITDLNPASGMASVRESVPSAVISAAVPGAEQTMGDQSLGDIVQGAVAPHMKRFQQISNTVSKVGNALSNGLPTLPNLNPSAPTLSGEQYDHNW